MDLDTMFCIKFKEFYAMATTKFHYGEVSSRDRDRIGDLASS